jgi:hypothetical protein
MITDESFKRFFDDLGEISGRAFFVPALSRSVWSLL